MHFNGRVLMAPGSTPAYTLKEAKAIAANYKCKIIRNRKGEGYKITFPNGRFMIRPTLDTALCAVWGNHGNPEYRRLP